METVSTKQAAIENSFPIIVEEPVMWGDYHRPRAADQYKALVDSRSGRVFSIVTNAYQLITHEGAIQEVEKILSRCTDLRSYQVSNEFYNAGGRMRRTYTFPGVRSEISTGDDVSLSLHLFNSYDKSWPFILLLGAFRFVCANGLVVGNRFVHIQKRHTFGLTEINLEENIKTAITRFQMQAKQWQRMANIWLSDKTYQAVMGIMNFGKNATEIIEEEFSKQGDDIGPSGRPIMTIWSFYNVLTSYITLYAVSLNHRVQMENRLRLAMERFRMPRSRTAYGPIRPRSEWIIR